MEEKGLTVTAVFSPWIILNIFIVLNFKFLFIGADYLFLKKYGVVVYGKKLAPLKKRKEFDSLADNIYRKLHPLLLP